MPQTLEEVDRLRAELVAAIEQLDEHRATLAADPAAPPPSPVGRLFGSPRIADRLTPPKVRRHDEVFHGSRSESGNLEG